MEFGKTNSNIILKLPFTLQNNQNINRKTNITTKDQHFQHYLETERGNLQIPVTKRKKKQILQPPTSHLWPLSRRGGTKKKIL